MAYLAVVYSLVRTSVSWTQACAHKSYMTGTPRNRSVYRRTGDGIGETTRARVLPSGWNQDTRVSTPTRRISREREEA